jgi:gamma-glutamylcyclotransferase (GGCT)/AIG2-like uncharacterized protein YtfP
VWFLLRNVPRTENEKEDYVAAVREVLKSRSFSRLDRTLAFSLVWWRGSGEGGPPGPPRQAFAIANWLREKVHMQPTELFVYGTLRHDQPEHAKYCRGVTGWRPARLRAALWLLPAGYRIATVSPEAVLLTATADPLADESKRSALAAADVDAAGAIDAATAPWLDGEVLSFRDAGEAWPPLDRWEEFTPGGGGCYARVVIPVEVIAAGGEPRLIACWAYVATETPPGARELR